MKDQDDISSLELRSTNDPEVDRNCLDAYIEKLKDYSDKMKKKETPPPKGQVFGIIIAIVLIVIISAFTNDSLFTLVLMGTILAGNCNTARFTIANFYEEAANALESYRNTGSIPEINNQDETVEYINCVIAACDKGLGDNTIRTPKQWVKGVRN